MKMEKLKAIREEGAFIKEWSTSHAPAATYLSFIDAEGKQCNFFTSCKDYMHDILNAAINKRDFSGMYHHCVTPLDLSITRIAVGFGPKTDGSDEKVLRVINFLHAIERAQGFKRTKLRFGGVYTQPKSPYKVEGKYEVWVFEGDRRWMHASPLISFYCMAIRMGFDYDGSKWNDFLATGKITHSTRDRNYCNESAGFWDKLIGNPVTKVFGRSRKKNYPSGFITHEKGFRWFAQINTIPTRVSHWKNLKKEA